MYPSSNHPSLVIKHIPSFIEYRMSNSSSDKDVFNKHSGLHMGASKSLWKKSMTKNHMEGF